MSLKHSDGAAASARHIALLDELRIAHEQAGRLSEMIAVLQAGHGLDEARIKELQKEWEAASNRASALNAELSAHTEQGLLQDSPTEYTARFGEPPQQQSAPQTIETVWQMSARHVREGAARIARQQELIRRLKGAGLPYVSAERLLVMLEEVQREHVAHLSRQENR